MGTRRRRTRRTNKSRKRKNKMNAGIVSNKYKKIQKNLKNISANMYNLLVEIFSSVEPSDYLDYSELDKTDLVDEVKTRTRLTHTEDELLTKTKDELLTILLKDDETENMTNSIADIQTELTKFLVSYESDIKRMEGTEPERKQIKKFYLKLRQIEDYETVTEVNLYSFQQLMLEQFMDVNNWSNELYVKGFNPLMILNKSDDYKINFLSILGKYDVKLDKKEPTFESEILLMNKKSDILFKFEELVGEIKKNTNYEYIGDFKKDVEADLLEGFTNLVEQDLDSSIRKPGTYLKLNDSSIIKHDHKRIIEPDDWGTYFGKGKFGKKLARSKAYEYSPYPPEHNLYLFFKKVIKDMEYKPNPTSKPEHEIEIRKYLQKAGFVGPRPNMDQNTKKKWYENQNLEIGEFVEQPNGSTSHPDLWVQLSMLRLSIEAKSNQGYYPMYGKTPPPRETVYIFSSKKQKYTDTDIIKQNGRTTITFGHRLLSDEIRHIMKASKMIIKKQGKMIDREIHKESTTNLSSIGMTSDVNIQHIGKNSNYWKEGRNKLREQEVLFYNWLDPQNKCEETIYKCKMIPIGGNSLELNFKCFSNNFDHKPSLTCKCDTHKIDFGKTESFSGRSFSEMEKLEHTRTYYYKIHPENDSGTYICHMCLMKYYTDIIKDEYSYDDIKNVIYINGIRDNIWYEINWTNYKENTWLSHKYLLEEPGGEDEIKQFWGNIMDNTQTENLKIKYYNGTPTENKDIIDNKTREPIIKFNGEEGYELTKKVTGEDKDMFTIPEIKRLIKKYNKNVWNIFVKEGER